MSATRPPSSLAALALDAFGRESRLGQAQEELAELDRREALGPLAHARPVHGVVVVDEIAELLEDDLDVGDLVAQPHRVADPPKADPS